MARREVARLLSNTAALQEFLPSLLGPFLSAHPNVDLALEERSSPEIVRAIARGAADIGIIADAVDPASELETFPLAEDRLVLVTPRRRPLGRRRRIAFADALAHDFVGLPAGAALQDHIDGRAARAGRQLRLRVRLSGFDAVCRLVESDIGVAIVPKTAAVRCRRSIPIRVVPLTDALALRHLRLCVKDARALPTHGQWLLSHLHAAELTGRRVYRAPRAAC